MNREAKLKEKNSGVQPARKPLTEEQIDQVIEERGLNYYFGDVARNRVVLRELCKRAAHGITKGPK